MTSRGRQYPDGPLLPPPAHIRLGAAFAEGFAEGFATVRPVPAEFWPEAAGGFLQNMLNPEPEPGPPYVHTIVPPEPVTLTSADPEPPPGTVVRDRHGGTWELSDEAEGGMWWRTDADDDPESWTKIAGNYGPVTMLEWGEP